MSWHAIRNGQICPTDNTARTLRQALDDAIVLARYDDAEYVVTQEVYVVTPNGDTVEVRRHANGRIVERETFAPGAGRKGEE